ncbi:MAG: hypothetical protein F9K23_05330 [Bacteroidetes bacterium]|nr:MAG: hypothetical protein F9K23_05330 [Bacteroidota bacterium]
MKLKSLLLFILVTLCALAYQAQANSVVDTALFDKSTVTPRQPDSKQIEEYKNNSDFNYEKSYERGESPLQRFLNWLGEKLFGTKLAKFTMQQQKAIQWIIIGLVVIGIVYFFMKNEVRTLWRRGNAGETGQSLRTDFIDLSASTSSLQSQLQKAIAAKNYKEAIRIYYTLTLKQLSSAGFITLTINKTNSQYLYELPTGAVKAPFKLLTFYFEYVFYGDFEATEALFKKAGETYLELTKSDKRLKANENRNS